jgi:hypothetical protein
MIEQKMLAREKQSSSFWARLNDDIEKTFFHQITFVLGKLTNKIGQKMLAREKQSSLFLARLNDDKEKTFFHHLHHLYFSPEPFLRLHIHFRKKDVLVDFFRHLGPVLQNFFTLVINCNKLAHLSLTDIAILV